MGRKVNIDDMHLQEKVAVIRHCLFRIFIQGFAKRYTLYSANDRSSFNFFSERILYFLTFTLRLPTITLITAP